MSFELHHGDCLEVMKSLPDNSVDAVITDPPYGTTACKWDSVIPFEPMWKELKRIAKPKAAICLFGSQPFTSALVMSNPQMFRYEWVWDKQLPTGFLDANRRPLRVHETVSVFAQSATAYYPEMRTGRFRKKGDSGPSECYGTFARVVSFNDQYYPLSILEISNANQSTKVHPTQKPVDLLRYFVRTYTQENETVLDFTMGSGTTGVACELENRNFIGIEKDAGYFEIAKKRIEDVTTKEPLFMAAA
jgi:site-specific DNA-methyltransferase (adenine-specific)